MTATQKQFDEFAAKWADSFDIAYKKTEGAAWTWSAQKSSSPVMASMLLELTTDLESEFERQLRIVEDITVKHAETLRALADR
jgi:hypothetical protein